MKTIVATGRLRPGDNIQMLLHTTFHQALLAARDRAAIDGANIVSDQSVGLILLGRPVCASIEVALK